MNILKRYCAVLFIAASMMPLAAQSNEEVLKQEVQVVQEYNPTISDAFKINEMPAQDQTEVSTPEFRYSITGKAMVGAPEVVPLLAAKLSKPPMEELFPTYVRAYAGNYNLLGGLLRYNLVQNDKFALALKASHDSSLGKLELPDNNKVDAPFHTTDAGLYMRHFFSDKTLSLDMDFDNFAYQYYGLQNIEPLLNYKSPIAGNPSMTGEELTPDKNQHQTSFGMNLGFMNQIINHQYVAYTMNLGFNTFGNKWGIKENQVGLNTNFNIPIGDFGISLEASVDHASLHFKADEIPMAFSPIRRQQTLVRFNPAMVRYSDKLYLRMGLRFGTGFDDVEDEFYLSPDLQLRVNIVDEVIALEGGIVGEIRPSYYREIMAENPFIAPDLNVKTAFHGVNLYLGVMGNFSHTTSFAARVDYSAFTDEHFYKNRSYALDSDPTTKHYGNLFDVDYDDGTLLKVSGELKFDFEPDFNLTLRGTYYNWELDSLTNAWYKPQMAVGVRANYALNESVNLFASANIIGERDASLPVGIEKLSPVYDINAGIDYRRNKRWHFFAEIRNIAASSYDRWYGYPSHGVNGRVGLGYSF